MRHVHSEHVYDARMASLDIDPDLLRTFLAVHRHRGITRAAEALYVSQPAVTRRLARLERLLGLRLLERLGRTIQLTEAGVALRQEAEEVLGSLDRLAESVRAHRDGERGRIRVGASTTPGLYVLPRLLVRFQEQNPHIDLTFGIDNSLHIEQRLLMNELDVGFVGAHLTHRALRLGVLMQDRILFYTSKDDPLARRGRIEPRDLNQQTLVAREPGSATRRLVDRWMARRKARPRRTLEIGCPEAAKPLVRAGVGLSYMSHLGLEGEGGAGLASLQPIGQPLTRPIYVATHTRKVLDGPLERLVGLVASATKS